MKAFSFKTWGLALALASAPFTATFANSELDGSPAPADLPKGVVVRVNEETGKASVITTDVIGIADDAQAKEAAAKLADGKEVATIPVGELDQESSKEAWTYWHGGRRGYGRGHRGGYNGGYNGGYCHYCGYRNYNYSYYNSGYYYNYQPYYYYRQANYSYYYYSYYNYHYGYRW